MDAQTELEIYHACNKLVILYCHAVDHGEGAKVADLFTEDGVWTSRLSTMEGREAILKGFESAEEEAGRMTKHVCSNFLLDIESQTRATGCTYFTYYLTDGKPGRKWSKLEGPQIIGEYHDTFVKTEDGWRLARRETHADFVKVED